MIPSPHSPTDSPHAGTYDSGSGPDGHGGTPSNCPSLSALLQTWAACAAGHPAPTPPCPYTDGAGSLQPTPKPATGRCIVLWPPCGDTLHNGNSRAPGTHGETRPGHVSISTPRHPQSRTAARCLRESSPPF